MRERHLWPILLFGFVPLILGTFFIGVEARLNLQIFMVVTLLCSLCSIIFLKYRFLEPLKAVEDALQHILQGELPTISSIKPPWQTLVKQIQSIILFLRISRQGADDKISILEEQQTEIKKKSIKISVAYNTLEQVNTIQDKLRGLMDVNRLLVEATLLSISSVSANKAFFLKINLDKQQAEIIAPLGVKLKEGELVDIRPIQSIIEEHLVKDTQVVALDEDQPIHQIYNERFKSAIIGPVVVDREIWGFLCVLDKETRRGIVSFQENEKTLLTTIVSNLSKEWKNAHLFEQATVDSLSRLYVRRYFEQRMEEELARARRSKEHFSVLLLDIDYFKRFNDTYGHQVGDKVIQLVSNTLKSCLREIDHAGRYGGEEMIVLLPNTSLENGRVVAERIKKSVEDIEIPRIPQDARVTVSIGIATYPVHGITRDKLIQVADDGLYLAKESGRNRVCVKVGE